CFPPSRAWRETSMRGLARCEPNEAGPSKGGCGRSQRGKARCLPRLAAELALLRFPRGLLGALLRFALLRSQQRLFLSFLLSSAFFSHGGWSSQVEFRR